MPAAPQRPSSINFGFLREHEEALVLLAAQAETLFPIDPVASIVKVRLFAELLAQQVAAHVGVYTSRDEAQLELLRKLRQRGAIGGQADQSFHAIRKAGNAAVHKNEGDHGTALHCLKLARSLAVWFHRCIGRKHSFDPPPFVPPRPPVDATAALRAELEQLRAQLASASQAAEAARLEAEAAERARLSAEERARLEADERAAAEALMSEAAARETELAAQLAALSTQAHAAPPAQVQATVEAAAAASESLDLDEASTRRLLDEQLRAAGWEADTDALRWARGARPQKGKNLAIAEWPTDAGPADYVLFAGLTPVAVVEAKRKSRNVSGSLQQAARYARGFRPLEGLSMAGPFADADRGAERSDGSPTPAVVRRGRDAVTQRSDQCDRAPFAVPFLFATNGRPYLRQIAEASGVWFRDARRPQNLATPLSGWYTPEGLLGLLKQDVDEANAKLEAEPTEYLGLRAYQVRAIRAVERAIESGARTALLAMATGTGKTRTCIGLCYRLLKAKRFRRILFLVDRSALGEQAQNAFKDARLESLQTFDAIFDMKGMDDVRPDKDTKLHVSTVQGLVHRVLYGDVGDGEDGEALPVDAYDCIIIDECHRGYTLDRELSEGELTFRDEADYISKYRRVLEHFDAVKIGLTATPALHTREIFGHAVFTYSYREAVVDGYLVDHEPPVRIVTALAQDGITFRAGEEIEVYRPRTDDVQLSLLPDEVRLEIDEFNRRVLTESFNRVVCEQLAQHIDPSLAGKTLVYCANDRHADLVVHLLKQALAAAYGEVEDDAVQKITGAADRPSERIRRFKNERLPNIAVTVDLLTTGIDVPAVVNLVFLRRVRSRILYEQMLGRATRLCPEIGKEVFHIYDAVDLYTALAPYTDMKPVVANVSIPFEQLAKELVSLTDEPLQREVLGQLIAKLDRKRRHLDSRVAELIEDDSGMEVEALLAWLRAATPGEARTFFAEHPRLPELLDTKRDGGEGGVFVSRHPDELRAIEHGYGPGNQRPEDYLDGFARFVREHENDIPALLVVTQRPRELTRAELKALRLALDRAGYSEVHLRAAWRDRTNQDIAASIIGHVRQAALGDALVPYEARVQQALSRILASRTWTATQRQWLERIGKQLRQELVLDRASIDAEGGAFAKHGGFTRLDKIFEGQLETLLGDLADEVWRVGA